jgi:hypothetical protein
MGASALDAIDRLLQEWDERLRRVDENLLALESEPTYEMLAPRSAPRAPLDGDTKRIVSPALDSLAQLFEHRGKLTDILDRAREIRESIGGISLWGSEQKEREILALLQGPSIELPPETTPLARRALLDRGSRDVRIHPEQLLAAMAAAFEGARDAVFAVQAAWARLEPALAALAERLADARRSAQALGVEASADAELAAIEREVEAARVRVACDPLGASGDLDARLVPRIEAIAGQLQALAGMRDRVRAELGRARELGEQVRDAHAAATRAAEQMHLEVEGARSPGAPTDAGLIAGLSPWLEKIMQAAHAGRWQSAEVGLDRWSEAARGYLANDARIADVFAAVLARRDELAGRLSARRAQATAIAARGGKLAYEADGLAREAEKLLGQRPTPLARASDLVERFEKLVMRTK